MHNIAGLVIMIFSFGSFAENDGDGGENDAHNIFIPFRGYCARKGVCSEQHVRSLSFEFVVCHLEWKKHGRCAIIDPLEYTQIISLTG